MQFLRALQIILGFFELIPIDGCIQFDFSREVSFIDNHQVIATYPGSSREELFGVCAQRCTKDIRCNAFDICSHKLKCKLIRGWTPLTPGNISERVCQRFQMVCQDEYFFDRQNKSCIQHYYCDFESDPESTCFLSDIQSNLLDELDWSINSGPTGSINTGPTSAYHGLNYKYIETSLGTSGNKAILESSKTFQVSQGQASPRKWSCSRVLKSCSDSFNAKTYCLMMFYHMYGDTINTLTIRTQRGNNAAIDRWQLSGNQGNVWHHLSGINLLLDSQTKIMIEATRGSSYTGDIAIDDVQLWPYPCP